jgi:ATP-binding cassette subfamily C protein LapB
MRRTGTSLFSSFWGIFRPDRVFRTEIMNRIAFGLLRPLVTPLWPAFREVIVLSTFVNLLALGVPVFVMQVYDRVVFHAGLATLQGLVIGIVIVLAFDWILRQARARILQRIALRVDVAVGRKLFEKLLTLPLATLEGRSAAHWQSLFRDVDVVRNTLSGGPALMLCDVPFATFFVILALILAPPIGWVLLAALPLFALLAWRSAAAMISSGQVERDSGLARDRLIGELITGRATVKSLALDDWIRPMWEERHAECIERAILRGAHADGYGNVAITLTMATTVAMTAVGAAAIIDQQMSIGALIAASMLSGRVFAVLNQVVASWRVCAAFFQSLTRLGELTALPGERAAGAIELPRPKGTITLEEVRFAYTEGGSPVIDGVSLTVQPGGVVALIGANGSGKSTLIKLALGLYRPISGRVLLDGADISQFTRRELARWMGYVPQEYVLFAGSIRDNIAHRRPDASDEDIIRASFLAGVHPVIVNLPDGYATDIGEAGRRLSAGQRQRIAIARALLGDPPVLLLDEPTTGLDTDSTLDLRATLAKLATDRTVVIATHSPQMFPVCRTIVEMERGRILYALPPEQALPLVLGLSRPGAKKPAAVTPGGAPRGTPSGAPRGAPSGAAA